MSVSPARLLIEDFGKASLEDARGLLERAVALDAGHIESLAALATTHGLRAIASPNRSDYEQALSYADRALALDPRHVRALVWKGYALAALARQPEAEAAFRAALAIDPDDVEALYFVAGTASQQSQTSTLGEAVALLQRALGRDERGIWWLALGTAHRGLGHVPEALYCFTRAERLEGVRSRFATAGAGAYTAEMLRRAGRFDEARAAAFSGLDAAERSDHAYRDTFRAHALTVIGRVALDQGNVAGAQTAFQQVLAQARGRPHPRACGHFVVHALCGLARATNDPAFFLEGRRLFDRRETYDFAWF